MKFNKFEGVIPEPKRARYNLQTHFKGFIKSGVKVATIDTENHYKSLIVAAQVLGVAAKKSGLPIKIMKRGETIFIVRTDM